MNDPLSAGAGASVTDGQDAALDHWIADAEAQAARYQQLSAGVAQVSVRESSPDGLITVTVNAGGVVTDLRISERATGMPGPQLATAVLATMRRAQARIAGRVAELMRTTVGEDTALQDAVLRNYHEAFPAPPEPGRPAAVDELRIGGQPPAPPMPSAAPPAPAPPPPAAASAPAPRVQRAARPVDDDWNTDNDSLMEEVDR